jgi:hypothetical protein
MSAMPDTDPPDPISCDLQIVENDTRAKQFACKIIVGNHTNHTVDILAINYRLGRGVSMQKNDDDSFVDLKEEYDGLKNDVKRLIGAAYVNASEAFRTEYGRNLLETLRSQFSFKSMMMAYLYLFTNRLSLYRKMMEGRFQQMDFPISNAKDAMQAVRTYSDKGFVLDGVVEILNAKINRMAAIEAIDQNFVRPEYVTQLQSAESYERVYVLKATRSFASIASYMVAFDTKLRWTESGAAADTPRIFERIISRSTSFDVTPSPVTLSIYAIIFSVIGVLLSVLPKFSDAFSDLYTLTYLKQYFVGGALAVVLYNSLEMTEFKDKIRSISWRTAMFVGVLCGLLSERMIQAISAFVGDTVPK